MASPTTTPLDDNNVGALLSLDQAMETLAARVTPAIVNVTVTSRAKATAENNLPDGDCEDMQQFGQSVRSACSDSRCGRNSRALSTGWAAA